MNIHLVYATNTGNTYLTAQVIRDMLSEHHQVTMTSVQETDPNVLDSADLIILGSSSWDWQGLEGHPLKSMLTFLETLKGKNYSGKKFALFGCGDRDFRIFCGAVNHLSDFVKNSGGEEVTEALRVDKFYIDVLHKIEQVKTWAHDLNQKLG